MKMTTAINIERKRGDTCAAIFIVTDETDGSAIDISGWTNFLLTVDPTKAPADDSGNLFQLTGTFVSDGVDG